MDVSNIIMVLLFILPGMLSERIYYELDSPRKDDPSEFKLTINGFLLSFPILLITSIPFAVIKKITSLKGFVDSFDDLIFLFVFTLAVLAVSVILGINKEHIRKIWIKYTNYLRKKRNKMPAHGKSCWISFLIDRNEPRFLEVIQDGSSHKGFAYQYSTLNEDASIILGIDKALYDYDDFNIDLLFTKVTETFIDIERNVVIKDYDMSDYYRWYEEKKVENDSTSLEVAQGV